MCIFETDESYINYYTNPIIIRDGERNRLEIGNGDIAYFASVVNNEFYLDGKRLPVVKKIFIME